MIKEDGKYYEMLSTDALATVAVAFEDYAISSTATIKSNGFNAPNSEFFSRSYALLVALWGHAFNEEKRTDLSKLNNDQEINEKIHHFLSSLRSALRKKDIEARLNSSQRSLDRYAAQDAVVIISSGDKEKIQSLINELRETIVASEILDEGHKRRLLKRLERMQIELNKNVSDLDVFWGTLSQAGIVMGKFGEDAKPIVDRTREILEILWKAQKSIDEIPPQTEFPKLPSSE